MEMENTYLETMTMIQNKNSISELNHHLNQEYLYEQANKQQHKREAVNVLPTSEERKLMYNVDDTQ